MAIFDSVLPSDFREIGNPIQLEHRIDPFKRVTNKARTFMNYTEIVPVNWKITLSPILQTQKEREKNKIRGGVKYDFEEAIKTFQTKCSTYGLSDKFAGLRIVTTSESIAQEDFGNNYDENSLAKFANSIKEKFSEFRDVTRSLSSDSDGDFVKMLKDPRLNNGQNGLVLAANNALEAFKSLGPAAESIGNMLYQGRTLSLPKIYKTSTYSPSLSLNVRLISPYGAPRSIQKHVVEPLIYLLLLAAPSTTDGLTYGKGTFLKIKCYGNADINLGYIENISVKRGGSDITFNKYGQPLFVDVSITIKSAFDGFAAVEIPKNEQGKPENWITVTKIDEMLNEATFAIPDPKDGKYNFKPIESDFGFTTIDNVIRSFQKFPDSNTYTNNGLYPSLNIGTSPLSTASNLVNQGLDKVTDLAAKGASTMAGAINTASSVVGDTISNVSKKITM